MNTNRNTAASFLGTSDQIMSFRITLLLLSYLFVQGCAPSLVSMDRSELEQLKYQPLIHVVHYPPPPLVAYTSTAVPIGSVFGPLVGGFVAHGIEQAEGEKLKRQCSLEDPSLNIRDAVIKSLSTVGIENFRLVSELLESDELDALRSKFGDSLVMDFKTRGWQLFIVPLSQWTTRRYPVLYTVQARLIRLRDSKVIWLGYSSFREEDDAASTWDELVESGCALLKAKFGQAADTCAQQLTDQLLGKTSVGK